MADEEEDVVVNLEGAKLNRKLLQEWLGNGTMEMYGITDDGRPRLRFTPEGKKVMAAGNVELLDGAHRRRK